MEKLVTLLILKGRKLNKALKTKRERKLLSPEMGTGGLWILFLKTDLYTEDGSFPLPHLQHNSTCERGQETLLFYKISRVRTTGK